MIIFRLSTLLLGASLLVLQGCEFIPKGATLYKIQGKKEYDQAFIHFPVTEGIQKPMIKLRWIDTNGWVTTATLEAGSYRFSARTIDGGAYYSREFSAVPGQRKYEFPEQTNQQNLESASSDTGRGPVITGEVSLADQTGFPRRIAIVFFGSDVTVTRTNLTSSRFEIHAPVPGKFRISLYSIGAGPQAIWTSEILDIKAKTDLGKLVLK